MNEKEAIEACKNLNEFVDVQYKIINRVSTPKLERQLRKQVRHALRAIDALQEAVSVSK